MRQRCTGPARWLLLASICLALPSCLAEARTDAELDEEIKKAQEGGPGGPQAACTEPMLGPFNGQPAEALASCFLAPFKCKNNGANCVNKCLGKQNLPMSCVQCVGQRTPCVLENCKGECVSVGLPRADAGQKISCAPCVADKCNESLAQCTTPPPQP